MSATGNLSYYKKIPWFIKLFGAVHAWRRQQGVVLWNVCHFSCLTLFLPHSLLPHTCSALLTENKLMIAIRQNLCYRAWCVLFYL